MRGSKISLSLRNKKKETAIGFLSFLRSHAGGGAEGGEGRRED